DVQKSAWRFYVAGQPHITIVPFIAHITDGLIDVFRRQYPVAAIVNPYAFLLAQSWFFTRRAMFYTLRLHNTLCNIDNLTTRATSCQAQSGSISSSVAQRTSCTSSKALASASRDSAATSTMV